MMNLLASSFAVLLASVLTAQNAASPGASTQLLPGTTPAASTPRTAEASTAPAAASIPATRRGNFVLEAGEHRTSDLVDKVAQFLGRNILFCEIETAQCGPSGGVVKLQQRLEVDAAGAEELLCHLLYIRGLTVVAIDETKGMYEVISMAGSRAREVVMRAPMRTLDEVLARPQLRMMVTTSMTLENINANIATNAMRPFFAQAGGSGGGMSITLGTAGSENGLLISGFQDQVAAVVRMVQNLDANAAKGKAAASSKIDELEMRIANLEARLLGEKK